MNSQWQIDLFNDLQSATDMQDVLDASLKIVKPLGFEFCTFKTKFAMPLVNRKTYVLGTNEDKVNQKNSSGGYDKAPVTMHCSKTNIPAIWTGKNEGAIFEKDPELVEEYFSWGHKGGWAQSVNEGSGQFSMFIVDGPEIMAQSYLENHVNFNLE
ncbi:autoinducer binding domain-containing protein [Zymobacter palmae]|uniref:autoinducer binding domain-containing protein n=1 Tax=Zymobacter palmae TaxID=33074 RepID=UPI000485BB40|nr:autoinducer binding domain-containing protein [Zymobacter palmae]